MRLFLYLPVNALFITNTITIDGCRYVFTLAGNLILINSQMSPLKIPE